jgi:GNAT superfamily N-acetyltransferase
MLSIEYLADYPQFLPTVAAWDFGEWGHHAPTKTVQDYEAGFRNRLNRNTIPLTVIGLWDGIPAGMSSIFDQDMDIHPELTPWLAAVYVAADHRSLGIGSKLVGAIEEIASHLRIARLYLWTPDKEHFYSRLGWSVLERPVYFNQPVALMSKEILPG